MTTVVSFSHSSDGRILSASSNYTTARNGNNLSANTDSPDQGSFGQWLSGTTFNIFQYFTRFPYTRDTAELVTAGYFRFVVAVQNSATPTRALEVREFDWGTSVTTADWRTPAQLTALTQLGRVDGVQGASAGAAVRAAGSSLLSRLGSNGEVRTVAVTDRQRAGNTPSVNELTQFRTADFSGTTSDPTLVYTTAPISDLLGVLGAQVQLSDGTHAFLEGDGASLNAGGTVLLRHHNGTSASTIATLPAPAGINGFGSFLLASQHYTLVADASDNLYVIGNRSSGIAAPGGNVLAAKAYAKGVGHSWTGVTYPGGFTIASASMPSYDGPINNIAAAWHDEGTGGTIVTLVGHTAAGNTGTAMAYALLNCNFLLTGSGSLLRASGDAVAAGLITTASSGFNSFTNETGALLDVCAAPGGTNRGFVVSARGTADLGASAIVSVARYQLAAGGASFADVDNTTGPLIVRDAAAKARVVTVSASEFVTLTVGTGSLVVRHWQNIGTASTFTTLASVLLHNEGIASLPSASTLTTSQAWDALHDPASNRLWIYYFDVGDSHRLMRTSVDLNTGLAAGDEVEVATNVGASGSTNHAIRVHRGALTGQQTLVTVANESSGGAHSSVYVTDTLNVAPTQPTLTPKANFDADENATFAWTFNDPNPGDTQSAYQLQIDEVGGSNVFDSNKTTSGANTHNLSGGTLSNGNDYRWRVRAWDSEDAESPWSNFSQFTTSASGTVTIVDPDQDNPDGVITGAYLVEWEVAGTTQHAYRVVVRRTDTEGLLVDTDWTVSTDTTFLVQGMLSDVEYRVEVTVRDAAEVTTNTASVLITPSYGRPEQPEVSAMVDADGYILVSVVNPEPQGDRPEVARNDILRRVAGSGSDFVKVGEAEPDGAFRDYTTASGITYEYVARGQA